MRMPANQLALLRAEHRGLFEQFPSQTGHAPIMNVAANADRAHLERIEAHRLGNLGGTSGHADPVSPAPDHRLRRAGADGPEVPGLQLLEPTGDLAHRRHGPERQEQRIGVSQGRQHVARAPERFVSSRQLEQRLGPSQRVPGRCGQLDRRPQPGLGQVQLAGLAARNAEDLPDIGQIDLGT